MFYSLNLLVLCYSFLSLITFNIKRIKTLEFSTSDYLTFKDQFYLVLFSILLSISNLEWRNVFIVLILFVMFVSFLDAILFSSYGMTITFGNIKTFLQGAGSFKGEEKKLFDFLDSLHWVYGIGVMIFSFFSYAILSFHSDVSLSILCISTVFVLSKSKINKRISFLCWLTIFFAFWYGVMHFHINSNPLWAMALFSIIIAFNLYFLVRLPKHYFSSDSVFSHFLRGNYLKYDKKYENDAVISIIQQSDTGGAEKTHYRGQCKDANVVLFALEALSLEGYSNSEYAKKIQTLFDSNVCCKKFYSVCPNTNQSAYQIYTSSYGDQAEHRNLAALDYHATYISTQNANHFDLKNILLKLGMNEVIDNQILNEKNNDYDLFTQINAISDGLKRGNAFYHITNLQTHSPYSVVDKKTFHQSPGTSEKSTYLNAVDEILFIVYSVLSELKKRGDLDNTIVVVTGDHGESFGEFGYYTHSASTVNSQIQIPLNIFHPSLPSQEFESGCLMDLMPTILDLLGRDLSHFKMDGQSLFQQNRHYLLCYSETKGANSPSNACVIVEDKKYYVDTVQNRYLILDKDDQILIDDPKEVGRIQSIVYCALEKHGLIR